MSPVVLAAPPDVGDVLAAALQAQLDVGGHITRAEVTALLNAYRAATQRRPDTPSRTVDA